MADDRSSTPGEVAEVVAETEENTDGVSWGSHDGRRALYVKSPRVARIGAALLAGFVLVGVARWVGAARMVFSPPALVCADCAPPDWYRWSQLLVAAVGITVALIAVAYLVYFAGSGRIWRRWHLTAMTFGILAATWSAMWILWWIRSLVQ